MLTKVRNSLASGRGVLVDAFRLVDELVGYLVHCVVKMILFEFELVLEAILGKLDAYATLHVASLQWQERQVEVDEMWLDDSCLMHSFDLLYGELERLQIEAVTVFVRLGLLKRKLRDDSAGTVTQKDEDSAAKVDALHLLVEIDVWRDGVEQAGGYLVRLVENEQRRVALIDRIVVFVFYLSLFLFMFFPIFFWLIVILFREKLQGQNAHFIRAKAINTKQNNNKPDKSKITIRNNLTIIFQTH